MIRKTLFGSAGVLALALAWGAWQQHAAGQSDPEVADESPAPAEIPGGWRHVLFRDNLFLYHSGTGEVRAFHGDTVCPGERSCMGAFDTYTADEMADEMAARQRGAGMGGR